MGDPLMNTTGETNQGSSCCSDDGLAWCSWCLHRTRHDKFSRRRTNHHVCSNCHRTTVPCHVHLENGGSPCLNMARAARSPRVWNRYSVGYTSGEGSGYAAVDDRYCAVHSGKIPSFASLGGEIDSIHKFLHLFNSEERSGFTDQGQSSRDPGTEPGLPALANRPSDPRPDATNDMFNSASPREMGSSSRNNDSMLVNMHCNDRNEVSTVRSYNNPGSLTPTPSPSLPQVFAATALDMVMNVVASSVKLVADIAQEKLGPVCNCLEEPLPKNAQEEASLMQKVSSALGSPLGGKLSYALWSKLQNADVFELFAGVRNAPDVIFINGFMSSNNRASAALDWGVRVAEFYEHSAQFLYAWKSENFALEEETRVAEHVPSHTGTARSAAIVERATMALRSGSDLVAGNQGGNRSRYGSSPQDALIARAGQALANLDPADGPSTRLAIGAISLAASAMTALPLAATALPLWALREFHATKDRASIAGILLADMLVRTRAKHSRGFVLMGHSLGADVIYWALRTLGSCPPGTRQPIVRQAYLLGAAVGRTNAQGWEAAASAVSGRIYNCYSVNDMILRAAYLPATLLGKEQEREPAGLGPIQSSAENIVNVDVSGIVQGHSEFKEKLVEVLQLIHHDKEGLDRNVCLCCREPCNVRLDDDPPT